MRTKHGFKMALNRFEKAVIDYAFIGSQENSIVREAIEDEYKRSKEILLTEYAEEFK